MLLFLLYLITTTRQFELKFSYLFPYSTFTHHIPLIGGKLD